MDGWMDAGMDECRDDGRPDGQTVGRTDAWSYERMDECKDGLTVGAWYEHASSLDWWQAGRQDMTHAVGCSQAHQQGLHSPHMISWQVFTVCDLMKDVECTYTCLAVLGQHSHQHRDTPYTTARVRIGVVALGVTQIRQQVYGRRNSKLSYP